MAEFFNRIGATMPSRLSPFSVSNQTFDTGFRHSGTFANGSQSSDFNR
jgi:hypothetical protein